MNKQNLECRDLMVTELAYEEQTAQNGGAVWWLPIAVAAGVFVANKIWDQAQRDSQCDWRRSHGKAC